MNKKIIILGAGESGIGAALLAKAKGYDYILSESGKIKYTIREELLSENLIFEEGGHSIEHLDNAEMIVKSPGIPDTSDFLKEAIFRDIPIISEVEFAYRHIDRSKKIIAITGTNGKTTTTLLTHHLMLTCGYSAGLCGNIGTSFARLAVEDAYDYYVVEISSFQLDGIVDFKPSIAVLLNITPDHLDRYDYQFEKYIASKFRITQNLGKDQALIYFNESKPIVDELAIRNVEASLFAIAVGSGHANDGSFISHDHFIFNYKKEQYTIPISEVSLIGKHNMVNVMASVLSLLCINAAVSKIVKGLKSFKNAPHRLEDVGTIHDIKFINDSKGTNVDAVYYALDGINKKIIWLAGGVDKGNDYKILKGLVLGKVRHMICIGKNNAPLKQAFESSVPFSEYRDIQDAVDAAYKIAEPGDIVLLSPACSSFDLYKNYEDRGDKFRTAVAELIQSKSHSKGKVS
jgi:UDP-N-acetylmuramoylalanine--D-glutamate ligase